MTIRMKLNTSYNFTGKSYTAKIKNIIGFNNGAASVIDTERVRCYWPPEAKVGKTQGKTQTLHRDYRILQTC